MAAPTGAAWWSGEPSEWVLASEPRWRSGRLVRALHRPVHRSCASPDSACSSTEFDGNSAAAGLEGGVGGAAFLGRANFTLAQLSVHDNSAHLGGGLYVAADLSLPAELQYLQLRDNVADMGQGIFWCVGMAGLADQEMS